MAKHIHIHTSDYGTSEGAKKRWQKSAGMNTPEAHAKRAQLREQGENRAAYKASMQRQGKSTFLPGQHARPSTSEEHTKQSQWHSEQAKKFGSNSSTANSLQRRAHEDLSRMHQRLAKEGGSNERHRTAPKDPTAWNKGNLTPPKYTGGGVGVRGIPEGTYKPTGGYGGGRDSNGDGGPGSGPHKGGGSQTPKPQSEYAKRMASASPRYKELAETSPLKAHLAGQTPNYSAIAKADAERKRLNETKYKNVSTRPMRNTSKYFFNR